MKITNRTIVLAGIAVGIAALLLTALGNPANMGFCIACFERDIAGALHLHSAKVVQYVRPEIIGLVLGAFLMSLTNKEFRAKAGSAPATHFVLGALVMIGALVFLGCPLRMVIRIAGGDLSALCGLAGFIVGIYVGTLFLDKGFSLRRAYENNAAEGTILPLVLLGLFLLFLAVPSLFQLSQAGPGSLHAPVFISLLIAIIIGMLAQKARLCLAGGFRDLILFKDVNLLSGFVTIFLTILVGNLFLGRFHLGLTGQPIAHSDIWLNVLGMVIVGWGSVLLGGCPLRQLILAGSGNGDSAVTVLGMIAGAALSHNLALAASPDVVKEGVLKIGSVSPSGHVAVPICLIILAFLSFTNLTKEEQNHA